MNWIPYIFLAVALSWIVFLLVRIAHFSHRAVEFGKKAQPFTQHRKDAQKKILVIGDSTAVGTGAMYPEYSLVGRLATDLPDVQIINAAQNAMNLKELHASLSPHGSEIDPYQYIIIHIGGMDTITLLPLSIIRKHALASLALAKQIAHKQVFLVSVYNVGTAPIFQFPLNLFFRRRSRRISQLLDTLCQELLVEHIPLYSPEHEDALYKDSKRYFATDGLHPNDEGYGLWYERIRPKLLAEINKD